MPLEYDVQRALKDVMELSNGLSGSGWFFHRFLPHEFSHLLNDSQFRAKQVRPVNVRKGQEFCDGFFFPHQSTRVQRSANSTDDDLDSEEPFAPHSTCSHAYATLLYEPDLWLLHPLLRDIIRMAGPDGHHQNFVQDDDGPNLAQELLRVLVEMLPASKIDATFTQLRQGVVTNETVNLPYRSCSLRELPELFEPSSRALGPANVLDTSQSPELLWLKRQAIWSPALDAINVLACSQTQMEEKLKFPNGLQTMSETKLDGDDNDHDSDFVASDPTISTRWDGLKVVNDMHMDSLIISTKGAFSPFHVDPFPTMNTCLAGYKLWFFFPRSASEFDPDSPELWTFEQWMQCEGSGWALVTPGTTFCLDHSCYHAVVTVSDYFGSGEYILPMDKLPQVMSDFASNVDAHGRYVKSEHHRAVLQSAMYKIKSFKEEFSDVLQIVDGHTPFPKGVPDHAAALIGACERCIAAAKSMRLVAVRRKFNKEQLENMVAAMPRGTRMVFRQWVKLMFSFPVPTQSVLDEWVLMCADVFTFPSFPTRYPRQPFSLTSSSPTPSSCTVSNSTPPSTSRRLSSRKRRRRDCSREPVEVIKLSDSDSDVVILPSPSPSPPRPCIDRVRRWQSLNHVSDEPHCFMKNARRRWHPAGFFLNPKTSSTVLMECVAEDSSPSGTKKRKAVVIPQSVAESSTRLVCVSMAHLTAAEHRQRYGLKNYEYILLDLGVDMKSARLVFEWCSFGNACRRWGRATVTKSVNHYKKRMRNKWIADEDILNSRVEYIVGMGQGEDSSTTYAVHWKPTKQMKEDDHVWELSWFDEDDVWNCLCETQSKKRLISDFHKKKFVRRVVRDYCRE